MKSRHLRSLRGTAPASHPALTRALWSLHDVAARAILVWAAYCAHHGNRVTYGPHELLVDLSRACDVVDYRRHEADDSERDPALYPDDEATLAALWAVYWAARRVGSAPSLNSLADAVQGLGRAIDGVRRRAA